MVEVMSRGTSRCNEMDTENVPKCKMVRSAFGRYARFNKGPDTIVYKQMGYQRQGDNFIRKHAGDLVIGHLWVSY